MKREREETVDNVSSDQRRSLPTTVSIKDTNDDIYDKDTNDDIYDSVFDVDFDAIESHSKASYLALRDPSREAIESAIKEAALSGHPDIVKFLFAQNPPQGLLRNLSLKAIESAIKEAAALSGRFEIVKLLLSDNPSLEAIESAIKEAAFYGHFESVALLLSDNLSLEAIESAVKEAASNDHSDIVQLLLALNSHNPSQDLLRNLSLKAVDSAIKEAKSSGDSISLRNHLEIEKLLLSDNPSREAIESAIEKAASHGHFEIVKLLLSDNLSREAIESTIKEAAECEHFEIVKLLLSDNLSLSLETIELVIKKAAECEHFEIVKRLLSYNLSLEAVGDVLHSAVTYNQVELVVYLLKKLNVGRSFDSFRHSNNQNLLMGSWCRESRAYAAELGHLEIVKALLPYKRWDELTMVVDADGRNPERCDPDLTHAAANGSLEIVKLLLAHSQGQPYPLMAIESAIKKAASKDHFEIVKRLLSYNLSLEAVGDVLHSAVFFNQVEAVVYLLKKLNVRRSLDELNLVRESIGIVAYRNHIEVMELLLEKIRSSASHVSEYDIVAALKQAIPPGNTKMVALLLNKLIFTERAQYSVAKALENLLTVVNAPSHIEIAKMLLKKLEYSMKSLDAIESSLKKLHHIFIDINHPMSNARENAYKEIESLLKARYEEIVQQNRYCFSDDDFIGRHRVSWVPLVKPVKEPKDKKIKDYSTSPFYTLPSAVELKAPSCAAPLQEQDNSGYTTQLKVNSILRTPQYFKSTMNVENDRQKGFSIDESYIRKRRLTWENIKTIDIPVNEQFSFRYIIKRVAKVQGGADGRIYFSNGKMLQNLPSDGKLIRGRLIVLKAHFNVKTGIFEDGTPISHLGTASPKFTVEKLQQSLLAAGIVKIEKNEFGENQIAYIDNNTGHFEASSQSVSFALDTFRLNHDFKVSAKVKLGFWNQVNKKCTSEIPSSQPVKYLTI